MTRFISQKAAVATMAAFLLFITFTAAAQAPLPENLEEALEPKHVTKLLETPFLEASVQRTMARQGLAEREALLHRLRTDLCLAEKAAAAALSLGAQEMATLERELHYPRRFALYRAVDAELRVLPGDLERVIGEQGWRHPLAPEYRAALIHVDASQAATQEERAALAARARQLAAEATPENFADLARLWSDLPSAAKGGRLPALDPKKVGPQFAQHLAATPPGTIGGPFETETGWNIIWLQHFGPPREPYTEEQLRFLARDFLITQRLAELEEQGALHQAFEELRAGEDLVWRVQEAALHNALLVQKFVLQQVQEHVAEPTDEQLQAIYEDRFAAGARRGTQYKVRELLVRTDDWQEGDSREAFTARRLSRDAARELRARALAGQDFAALAREHSVAPTAQQGGLKGWLQPPTDAHTDRALAALEPGGISLPIPRRGGFQLLFLEAVEPAPPPQLSTVRPALLDTYWQNARLDLEAALRKECAPPLAANPPP